MERFGNYILLDRVGMGGMAEVHRGLLLGRAGFTRPVAIKRILPHLLEDATAAVMLVDEARLAATLQHPNIVRVMDLGQHAGRYFIAMDYLQGQRLISVLQQARAAQTPLPTGLLMWVMTGLLEALAYAHAQTDGHGNALHIVHRDVSPDNVMITYDGGVFIMDFGVARAVNTTRLTTAGTLRGKPSYMSPEVVSGEPVTQQADLYAAAVVLHELLSLRPMREAENEWTMLALVKEGRVPRFEEHGAQVPAVLASVVYQALDPDPAARFADARALLGALQQAAMLSGVPAWNAGHTATWMAQHFGEQRAAEQEAQRRFDAVAQEIHGASPRELNRLLARASISPMDALRRRRRDRRVRVAVGLMGGVLLAGGLALWLAPTEPPPPAAHQPDPPPPVVVVQPPEPPVTSPPAPPEAAPPHADPPSAPEPRQGARHGRRAVPRIVAVEPPQAERAAPVSTEPGRLALQSKPWGRVLVDGKDTGMFTPSILTLPPGPHRLEVVNDELGVRAHVELEMPPGGNVKQSVTLK